MAQPNGKYALLVTNERLTLQEHVCADGARIRLASVAKLFERDFQMFRRDFGSHTVAEIEGSRVVFLLGRPSIRPEVSDAENDHLMSFARWAWYAYQLARPHLPAREMRAWIFSGPAELGPASGDVHPRSANGWEIVHELFHPHVGDEGYPLANAHGGPILDDWPARMAALYNNTLGALSRRKKELPPVVDAAIVAYSNALRTPFTDLRVPLFVRSAECILAVPRNGGKRTFAERGAKFLRGLVDPYLSKTRVRVREKLEQIYELRNACVHGKVVVEEMRRLRRLPQARRYQYLAELLAARTTIWGLKNHALLRQYPTRLALEGAWAAGAIQP
jgi:hypothetical protein